MMDYKNIVCPIDGTELTDVATEQASYISNISGARLVLVHVVQKYYHAMPMVTNSKEWEDIHKGWMDEGWEILEREESKLKEKGVKNVETVLREGEAAYEIIGVAKEKRADLIIMATHGYSATGKLFWGSVTDRVTKKSPCPVLWVFR